MASVMAFTIPLPWRSWTSEGNTTFISPFAVHHGMHGTQPEQHYPAQVSPSIPHGCAHALLFQATDVTSAAAAASRATVPRKEDAWFLYHGQYDGTSNATSVDRRVT